MRGILLEPVWSATTTPSSSRSPMLIEVRSGSTCSPETPARVTVSVVTAVRLPALAVMCAVPNSPADTAPVSSTLTMSGASDAQPIGTSGSAWPAASSGNAARRAFSYAAIAACGTSIRTVATTLPPGPTLGSVTLHSP